MIKKLISYTVSAIGALGVALQNYLALDIFIKTVIVGFTTVTQALSGISQVLAVGLGGLCSGMVNFFINLDLLNDFLKRFKKKADSDTETEPQKLEGWRKFRYIAGVAVFTLTGILFGATAFTIGMATPLAALAVAIGVFVAIIMVIQEVETWLQSFDGDAKPKDIKSIFRAWKASLNAGKIIGHIIAAGNVLALSLMFTVGLAEVLIVFSVAALPAFIIGVTVAFTFGAFTEFYFYNAFIAKFCHAFNEKWEAMKATKYAAAGFFCVTANAIVNGALTYTGVALLTTLLLAAGVVLPPVGIVIGLCAVSAVFAAAASFILGMDFWTRKMSYQPTEVNAVEASNEQSLPEPQKKGLGAEPHQYYGSKFQPASQDQTAEGPALLDNPATLHAVAV